MSMDPIRPISRDDAVTAVAAVAEARVHRETPEEASERRRRETRERDRKRAARAWADSQLRHLEAQHEQVIVSEDESDDGHAHVDVRV
jgi:hypothetical protein